MRAESRIGDLDIIHRGWLLLGDQWETNAVLDIWEKWCAKDFKREAAGYAN